MAITFTLTPEDMIAARRLHVRTVSLILRAIIVVIVLTAAFRQQTLIGVLVVCGLMPPAIFFGLWLGSKWDDWRFLRQFRQNEEMRLPMQLDLVDGELVFTSDKSSTRIPRARILKIRHNARITLVYRSSALFHAIPARVMTSEIAAFLGLLPPSAQSC